MTRQKAVTVILLVIGVGGLLLLSAGLSETELTTRWNLYRLGDDEQRRELPESSRSLLNDYLTIPTSVLQLFLLSLTILLPLTLLLALFSPEIRRTLFQELRRAVAFAIAAAAIFLLLRNFNFDNFERGFNPSAEEIPGAPHWITHPSAVAAFLIGLFLLFLGALLVWRVWSWRRQSLLRLIALEARETVQELEAGGDFQNAILACYFGMCRVLREERRIERKQAVTSREFAQYLEQIGLAGPQVMRLTRLFEDVRYGARTPRPVDEAEAVACLSAVARLAEAGE